MKATTVVGAQPGEVTSGESCPRGRRSAGGGHLGRSCYLSGCLSAGECHFWEVVTNDAKTGHPRLDPGSRSSETWIPAFAGMTETRGKVRIFHHPAKIN